MVAADLRSRDIEFTYEDYQYSYPYPLPRGECVACGGKALVRWSWYTPDWFFPNGVVVESKGRLTAHTRKVLLAVREAHPTLDLRLLFQRDNPINTGSRTTYTAWATHNGFICAVSLGGIIPEEWLT
jgi:hypothetical protein